jgi:hypothetical protein
VKLTRKTLILWSAFVGLVAVIILLGIYLFTMMPALHPDF